MSSWNPLSILPPTWQIREQREDGASYYNDMLGLAVIVSDNVEGDGKHWVHLSVSHRTRIPTWRELCEVKSVFLGNIYAYQVLPPADRYVNIDARVLHLFHCLDGDPLSEFSGVVNGARTL